MSSLRNLVLRPQAGKEADVVSVSPSSLEEEGARETALPWGKKKTGPEKVPREAQAGSAGSGGGRGRALGWCSSGLLPWGGPGRVCSQPQLSSSPTPFLSGLGWLAPFPVSLQRQKPGAKLTAASSPPRSLSVGLPLPVSLSLFPSLQSPAPPSHPLFFLLPSARDTVGRPSPPSNLPERPPTPIHIL